MGHTVTGVVGAAILRSRKAVVIVGDGAMLMNSEVNTAAKYGIPAIWIVLNDGPMTQTAPLQCGTGSIENCCKLTPMGVTPP